jgi:Holliday junction resolvase
MNELRANGWFCFKVHGSVVMMAGLPDVICCAEGYFFGLETKMEGKRNNTSARQDYVRDLIRAAGGVYEVVTTPEQAVAVILARIG